MVVLTTDCLLFIEDESPLIFAFEMLLDPKSGINAARSKAMNLQDLISEVCESKSQVIVLEDLAINPEENAIAGLLASSSVLKIIIVLREPPRGNRSQELKIDSLAVRKEKNFG